MTAAVDFINNLPDHYAAGAALLIALIGGFVGWAVSAR